MEITDSFRVSTPIDATWKVLLDIERIAPCLPGAQLQEIDGDEYRGVVKVKVGPITAQYKGTATPRRGRRVDAHASCSTRSGRDTRGQGNAKATIVVTMLDDGGGTRVDVVTDLSITGKVAQFGRGVLADVSAKLLGQFVENLERDVLSTADGAALATPEPDIDLPAVADERRPRSRRAPPTADGRAPRPGPRKIDSAEASRSTCSRWPAAPPAKRLVPIAVGALVLVPGLAPARAAAAEAPRSGGAAPSSIEPMFDRIEPVFDPDGPGARASTPGCRAAATASSPGERNQPRALGVRRDPHAARRSAARAARSRSTTSSRRSSRRLRPSAVAVERVLFQTNVRTAMSVGQASGLALVAAARAGIPVAQYSPNEVKLAVTGDGRADKARGADDGHARCSTSRRSRSRPTRPTRSRSRAATSGAPAGRAGRGDRMTGGRVARS